MKRFVAHDFTIAMSSTICAVCGKRSLTQAPDWPWRWKVRLGARRVERFLNDESMKANRFPAMNESGMGWPWSRASSGFQSNISSWEGPPAMKRKMTDFARAG